MGSHESGVKGQNHCPRPAGHASFDAAQDTVGFLGCRCTYALGGFFARKLRSQSKICVQNVVSNHCESAGKPPSLPLLISLFCFEPQFMRKGAEGGIANEVAFPLLSPRLM